MLCRNFPRQVPELVEKREEDDAVIATARATIWAFTYRMLRPYFETTTGKSLQKGIKVLVRAEIVFHELYGYSLNIKDIVYSIQDTSTLSVGEHVVTCTATKENGKSSSANILIIVKLAYTEQSWTEAGTYSWTCPDKTYRIRIALCGGGGGSAIGNGGTATAGNGESSSFGDLISVSGGNGGESSSGQGGTGGTPNGRNGAYSSGSLQTINGGTGFELSFTLSNGAYGSGGNGWIDKRGAVISTGGSGGYYTGYIDVTPNQTYTIMVGKNGSNSINSWDVNDSVWGGSSGFVLIGFGGDI